MRFLKKLIPDIYIGLIGSQYYGRNSVKRGVSATEREYAAAVSADVECWVYLSNVEKRDKKTEALVKKVGSAATWAKYEGFPELRDAVFSSFVDFLDKRHLLVVSDFDVMACPQARMEDTSRRFQRPGHPLRPYSCIRMRLSCSFLLPWR